MKSQERHIVDVLFVLALFGIFAFSALMLVIIGANVYENTVNDMSGNFDSRTAVAYISEKLRQNDLADGISLERLEDADALALSQYIEDTEYCTYLYYHEGYLKELFMRKDADLVGDVLEAGQPVMKLTSLEMEQISDHLLSLKLTTVEGEQKALLLNIHSAQQ